MERGRYSYIMVSLLICISISVSILSIFTPIEYGVYTQHTYDLQHIFRGNKTDYRGKVLRLIDEIKSSVSSIRGLKFSKELNVVFINTSWALEQWAPKSENESSIPIDMLYREKIYKMTFIAPYNFSIVSGQRSWIAMFMAAVAGTTIYINTDYFNPDDRSVRNILSHELTHVLQFLNLNIYHNPNTTDSQLAFSALIEGDAGYTQHLYCITTGLCKPSPPTFIDLSNLYLSINLFPYIYGENFIRYLYNYYGNWTLVNRAYDKPPISTSMVMHPERYIAYLFNGSFTPERIAIPYCYTGNPSYIDTLGEYYLLLILAPVIGLENASTISSGWNGDRISLYLVNKSEGYEKWVLCWNISFFSMDNAKNVFSSMERVVRRYMENVSTLENNTIISSTIKRIDNKIVFHGMKIYLDGKYIFMYSEYEERYNVSSNKISTITPTPNTSLTATTSNRTITSTILAIDWKVTIVLAIALLIIGFVIGYLVKLK
ncbi:hypothetical protein Igag_1632 [Ignisphaera aggregans DSM 17230]|uniref:eCIS core domain-containing protein n=1 Tax=Ignisphaera aggregans (strain DSM 17230 / JCM 13409 / AQ1.S1) TaxID=583356 RepID=E0SRP9_IGNAA|nr:hypothetical protein Igag_1632 [Ignisphaera aggregans DSM 17230]